MNAPASIAASARKRIKASADEIRHSLKAIESGKPFNAEPDSERRNNVLIARAPEGRPAQRRALKDAGPEAIWGDTIDFVDVAFFERGRRAGRAVCRIVTRTGNALGTGFLISPRLILTNNHVIGSPSAADGVFAEFDYERDSDGSIKQTTRFNLDPRSGWMTCATDDLDYTVVAVGAKESGPGSLGSYGFLPLSSARDKHVLGDWVNIIQHPDGRFKEAVVRENQIVSRPKSGTVIHYVADTEPGSSGSPVLNVLFEVVALHHWGGPHRELVDEKGVRVPRTVNEGIRASAITIDMGTRKTTSGTVGHDAIEEALMLGVAGDRTSTKPSTGTASTHEETVTSGTRDDSPTHSVSPDGTVTWKIPLSVSVRLGALPEKTAAGTSVERKPAAKPRAEAKMEIDTDYARRTGYDEGFLGVSVPLPALSAAQKKVAARNARAKKGDNPYELAYEHFSAIMNGNRRLAFFTATNIDGADAKNVNRTSGVISDPDDDEEESLAEGSEQWFQDERIGADEQTPSDFFSGQTTFDQDGNRITNRRSGDHMNRMFQQGHLTRRQDPLWGNDDTVLRAHADTFHVTNRAPQVGYFNMGAFKRDLAEGKHPGGTLHWRALEDFVLNNARADKKRVSVFTGPVFDDKKDYLWSRGRDDMKGFRAPREYWKIVLRVEQSRLAATALLIDQSPLIDFLPEMMELPAAEATRVAFEKVKRYHCSVAEIERRTGLDFGNAVRKADTFRGKPNAGDARLVENVGDVEIGPKGVPMGKKHRSRRRNTKSSRAG
jgi:endonuclease G